MKHATAARALIAAAAVLAVGAAAMRSLLGGTSPSVVAHPLAPNTLRRARSPATTAPPDASVRHTALAGLTVSNVTGPVERRSTEREPWRAVHAGDTIALNESLRTGSGGAAVLELQDHTTIWLWPESQVAAERLDDELERVGIAGGRLDLTVPMLDRRSVEVATSTGATARTHGAHFSIIVDGAQVATVATLEGEVDVVSGTGSVRVPPGMQTRARPGAAPEVVMAIPPELLLQVDWPTTVLRSRNTTLSGRAPAGVLVSVGGTRVVVNDDGTFRRDLQLQEGDNHVDVTADDVVGRHVVRRSPVLHVDTQPPSVGAHGRWE